MSKLVTYFSVNHKLQQNGIYKTIFDTLKGKIEPIHIYKPLDEVSLVNGKDNKLYFGYQDKQTCGFYIYNEASLLKQEADLSVIPYSIHAFDEFLCVLFPQHGEIAIYEFTTNAMTYVQSISLRADANCCEAFVMDRYLGVVCEGIDCIYLFDPIQEYKLIKEIVFPKGSGPCQVILDKNQQFMYTLGKNNNEIYVHMIRSRLTFQGQQIIPVLPSGERQKAQSVQMRMHPSGKFIYTITNKLQMITSFEVIDGVLKQKDFIQSGGKSPNGLWLDSSGRWMIVTHAIDGKIVVFQLDPDMGDVIQITDEKVLLGVNSIYVKEVDL